MRTYMEEYKRKLISAEEAAQLVKSNQIVDYGTFATKPIDFDRALGARAGEENLKNVTIRGLGSALPIPEVVKNDPTQKSFIYGSWYMTALERKMSDLGLCVHYPFNCHEANGVLRDPRYRAVWPSLWCSQVTPMNKAGFFNFGIANAHNRVLAESSPITIVEVNETFPWCCGGFEEGLHISEVDYIIEGSNTPIFALPPQSEANAEEMIIARMIMEEIHDGCCIQLGIGALPNAIGMMITNSDLKDLGVQTEMFCDAYTAMYEAGKITNAKKGVDRYKSTYSFCYGTQETYDFMDQNPRLASCPLDYTNDPRRIALNDNVISINNIMEVDLLGQVCSESKGLRQISGTGGQMDFVIGAFESKNGKSFLAFTSTFKDKEGILHSRVRPLLTTGATVTIPRTLVNYLVTEYGKVDLKTKSIWQRAEAIINLAHPDFRDELIKEATQMKIWRPTNKIS